MEIKVLGAGCARCEATVRIIQEVLAENGVSAEVEKVTDLLKIAGYGVLGMPAVVVDGQVKSVGNIPTKDLVRSWIKK